MRFRVWLVAILPLLLLAVLLVVPPSVSLAMPGRCESLFSQAAIEPWFSKLDFQQIEEKLRTLKIVSMQALGTALKAQGKKGDGSTAGLALVEFEDGTRAVWKPGLRNLAEVDAYKAARKTGSRLISPTVERIFDTSSVATGAKFDPEIAPTALGVTGSLQLFIPTSYDLTKLPRREREAIWALIPIEQRAERDIFNFVFGNWDLHWGNVLVDDSNSVVSIDNGVIRMRQQVRFGELPFKQMLIYPAELRTKEADQNPGPFPFDSAVYLDHPSVEDVTAFLKDRTTATDLDRFIRGRVKDKSDPDLSMRVVFWNNSVWIQGIGFQNYGPTVPPVYPADVVDAYRALTFEILREIFRADIFPDVAIREMLERRDELVEAAANLQ